MYYLQSRYYDLVVKRMLCADDESLTAGAALNNNNLFSYCDNNPVNRADGSGEIWNIVAGAIAGAAIEAITCLATGEEITMEGILLAGTSGAISTAFGFLGSWPSSPVGRYLVDVAVGVGSDTMAYMFNNDTSELGSTIKQSILTNATSVGISRVAGSAGKAIGKHLSKGGHNPSTKSAKKGSSVSKNKEKSARIKSKISGLKKNATQFLKKHSSTIRDHVSSFTTNCLFKWKKIRRNLKKKWEGFWRKVRT